MLPFQFRPSIVNNLDITLGAAACKLHYQRKKLNVSRHNQAEAYEGQLFETEQTAIINAGTTGATATASAAAWIPHGNYTACDCWLEVTTTGTPTGTVAVYMDKTGTVAGTNADDAASSTALATITFAASGTKRKYFELT